MSQGLGYRNDVDGLRALAVVLVVLYHLKVPGFGGGFVGVDVFFVISGFVVTRVIAPRIAAREFSLLSFYKNRFWRLQPPFFLLLAVTLAASAYLLSPTKVLGTAQSGLAASALSANFYFWATTSSYASDLAEQQPLLHTWSLAVEEQFYLIWPTLLLLGSRWRWLRRPVVIIGLLLALVGLSEWLARVNPSLAYYLLPARIMELGIGAALVPAEHFKLPPRPAALTALVGLGLVVGAAVWLDELVRFPGLLALLPCSGAALLIQGGATKGVLSPVFENPVSQFLGRVSYSWYLWHWPPIALLNYAEIPLTPAVSLGLGLGSLGVAATSYRFWETPTRRAPSAPYRFATLALGLGAVASLIYQVQSAPASVARAKKEEDAVTLAQPMRELECLLAAKDWSEIDACAGVTGKRKGKRLLVWGDSHAKVYRRSLQTLGKKLGWVVTTLPRTGCPPLFGVRRVDADPRAELCTEELSDRIAAFIQRHDFDAILLVARFGLYETGWIRGGKLMRQKTHFIADAKSEGLTAEQSAEALRRGLLRTARRLVEMHKGAILIALPTPVMPKDPQKDKTRGIGISKADYLEQRSFVERVYEDFPPQIVVFDPSDAVCRGDWCPGWDGDKVLYGDDNHLSEAGYKKLAPLLKAALERVK